VGLYTAGHPIDAAIRATGLEFGAPISIGNDVWMGGGVIVNPGVTIGSNVVIGSGSVVTRDLPDGVVAVGNPCRVLRQITEADRIFWENQRADYERT
ncbi:MAG: DapH/DapD/GlmU-related protein, partial [Oscillospiraceae bacterium]